MSKQNEAFGFKPHPNPWGDKGSTVPSLHGLTHTQVCEISGGTKADISDRYIDVSGPAGSRSATVLALESKKLIRCRPRVAWNPDPWTSYSWQWRWTKKGERVAAGIISP